MKTTRRLSKVQVIRTVVQVLCFIFLPGLFASTFSSIKDIYISIINQSFSFTAYWPELSIILVTLPATTLLGRFFCGWMCAFGAMGDFAHFLSRKMGRRPIQLNEKQEKILKSLKYIFLIIVIVLIWSLGIVAFDGSADPWNVFGMLVSLGSWPSLGYLVTEMTMGCILLTMIFIGSFVTERFFCRYLCPLGALYAIISRFRIFKIKKPKGNCGSCQACTRQCAMGIAMYRVDKISSGECIHCFKCLDACPRKNIKASIAERDVAPLIVGAAAAAAMTGLFYVGTIRQDSAQAAEETIQTTQAQTTAASLYSDGTYEGSGTGFRGGTTTERRSGFSISRIVDSVEKQCLVWVHRKIGLQSDWQISGLVRELR
jgi:polyferredoxin